MFYPYQALSLLLIWFSGYDAKSWSSSKYREIKWKQMKNDDNEQQQPEFQTISLSHRAGFLGCTNNNQLCNTEELCFNDNLFGQCVSQNSEKDYYRFETLSDSDQILIDSYLRNLNREGYKESDAVSQCVLNTITEGLKYKKSLDVNLCNLFKNENSLLNKHQYNEGFKDSNTQQYLESNESENQEEDNNERDEEEDEDEKHKLNKNLQLDNLSDENKMSLNSNLLIYRNRNLYPPKILAFNRRERQDVKKPGPSFPKSDETLNSYNNNNNKLFYNNLPSSDDEILYYSPKDFDEGQLEYENLAPVKDKKDLSKQFKISSYSFQNDEEPLRASSESPNIVVISFTKEIKTWNEGSNIINILAKTFHLPENALSQRRINNTEVSFKVNSNPQNIDAISLAQNLNHNLLYLNSINQLDMKVAKAGLDENEPSILRSSPVNYQHLSLFLLLICLVFALSLSALIYCLTVTKSKKKEKKLGKTKNNKSESHSKQGKAKIQEEYKSLCRDWSKKTTQDSPKESSKEIDESSNRVIDEPYHMDISTGHMVLTYMEDHLKNKQRLEQEWVSLCGYEAEQTTTNVAYKASNKKKNRFPDKLPYDFNRVILNTISNEENNDYINASTVADHDPRNPSYILTQGPLSSTVADFWQMIWEQGCVVIVMLTRLLEHEQSHCTQYWPAENETETYQYFEVVLISEHIWCEEYLVRSMYLKNTKTGETRTVTQFHFLSWPAHGIPSSTKSLLDFRRRVNKSYRGRSCPIVVHCSDGVGRSGTYVLIDMVLNRIGQGCKEIDIAASCEHLRDQRGGIVQNKMQFEFCLNAVAEEVHAILKALPSNSPLL